MPVIQRHVLVTGRVQGVFFRESTRREAQQRGVGGWVKNLPDGRVEAVFQGEPAAVEALVQFCHSGPPAARVEHVEVIEQTVEQTFESFQVNRRD